MPHRPVGRLLAVLVLLCVTLTVLDAGERSPFGPLRTAADAVAGPPVAVAGRAGTAVADAVGAVADLGDDEADALREENARLRGELARRESLARRLAEWDALLALPQPEVVPARVVAAGAALGFERTVTVDAGSRDGVAVDATVVTGEGLVGRVVRTGPFTSVVLLLDDPGSGVGVRLAERGVLGLARGAGGGRLAVTLLQDGGAAAGDVLLTTGAGTFAPDVPVARVVRVDGDGAAPTAEAEPVADLGALDLVGVVVSGTRGQPRESAP